MKNLKAITVSLLVLSAIPLMAQQNLVDDSEWVVGADVDNLTNFEAGGGSSHHVVENGTNPFGATSPLWKISSGTASYPQILTTTFALDKSKTYRFAIWVRQSSPFNGKMGVYMHGNGNYSSFLDSQGILKRDINIIHNTTLPASDQWYLLVGFIKGENDIDTYVGGVYSAATNLSVASVDSDNSKFNTAFDYVKFGVFTSDSSSPSDYVHLFGPNIKEVNNGDDSVTDLLGSTPPDTQDPTAPTLSITGQSSTTVDLSWTGAADNTAVTGYKVYKDGTLETTLGNVSTYQVTGLTASTAYAFTVRALDAAANESVLSNSVPVTTSASGGGSTVWNSSSGGNINYTSGNVGIGTSTIPSAYKLAVDGKIISEGLKVQLQTQWPDYVFKKEYSLRPLKKLQDYIKEHGHLPNIPTAGEVKENGIEVGEMNRLLLEKIEELTLYILEQEQRIQVLEDKQ
ncbi:fibronectin type III domain-containing protein [Ulvibacterium marinum]|uniref:fibronectin type III domain-containing protein n=1 Tax=Ulvibacterium marinum TaxID=2419782 RepID=UPI002495798D|nr:fibronectin type III domain-containing protein [Ulvibacterium marinum]